MQQIYIKGLSMMPQALKQFMLCIRIYFFIVAKKYNKRSCSVLPQAPEQIRCTYELFMFVDFLHLMELYTLLAPPPQILVLGGVPQVTWVPWVPWVPRIPWFPWVLDRSLDVLRPANGSR